MLERVHEVTDRFGTPAWLVWLGWTVLFGLVCQVSFSLTVVWNIPQLLVIALIAVFAFLVGLAFSSWWLLLGPWVVALVLLIQMNWNDSLSRMYLPLIVGVVLGAVGLPAGLGAWLGVWLGKWWRNRRGATSSGW